MVAISFGSFACREAILVGFGSVDPKSLGSPFDAVSISASAVLGVDGNFISETFNKTGQQLLTYFSKEKSVFFAQVRRFEDSRASPFNQHSKCGMRLTLFCVHIVLKRTKIRNYFYTELAVGM